MASSTTKKIMDSQAINRSITRLAHEILERNNGAQELMLIGILTRGEPLQKMIQKLIKNITKVDLPIGFVDITFHRDDFRSRLVVPQVKGSNIQDSINDKVVVLVDDVLFTGRTIRAAMDELNAFGRPSNSLLYTSHAADDS